MRRSRLSLLALAFVLASCSDDNSTQEPDAAAASDSGDTAADTPETAGDPRPPSLAEQLGILKYAGETRAIEESVDGKVTTYTWEIEDGPRCMRGEPFRSSIRETGSEDLVIFLQGGGACWSDFCLAVTVAPPGIPGVDILKTSLASNPVADWNVSYLPYCDGSFFAGDTEIDDNLNGKGVRYHHGLANLSAALDVTVERFPAPRRILLAGSSGGAYGLLLAAPFVRHHYPDAELIVMFDSGFGLARSGQPDFLELPLQEFGLDQYIPDDCERCVTSGHLSALIEWFLERDDNVRMGLFSSWRDSILGETFLRVEPAEFAQAVGEESARIHAAFPDRFRRFIVEGKQHTALLGDATGIIGTRLDAVELPPGGLAQLMGSGIVIEGLDATLAQGVSMAAWLAALIDGDLAAWADLVEEDVPADEDSEGSGD